MRAFLVLALVASALARPEAPLPGYNYQNPKQNLGGNLIGSQSQQIPTGSYGAPGGSLVVQNTGGFGGSGGGNLGQSSSIFQSSVGSQFGQGGGGGFNLGLGGGSLGGGSLGGGSLGGGSLGGGSLIGVGHGGGSLVGVSHGEGSLGGGSIGGGNIGFVGGSSQSIGVGGGGGHFVQQAPLAPIIQKHIYVHVPPPEPVEEYQRHIIASAPRKNYKIIFIKAPTAPAVSPLVLQQQQQNQEKTIVYVLVKKPDEQEALQLSGVAPTKPSKPEVYFIKYKTQKDVSLDANKLAGNIGSNFLNEASSGSSSVTGSLNPSPQYGPPGHSGPY